MQFFPKSLIARAIQRESIVKNINTLTEGFDMTRKELGEVPFKSSSITDNHIKSLIKSVSKKTGVPEVAILAKMATSISQIEDFKQYSPLLYNTMSKNAVNNAAFELIEHSADTGKIKFSVPIFMKLCKMVELEHTQFFPLRAPGEANYIFHIDPILVPDRKPEKAQFNSVGTAAATEKGDFIFNTIFMQKLIDWATIEQLKPTGKKYVCNGGTIPDEYAYIEFLIMHELLHYTYGDFASGKRLGKYSHRIHNWASDFRSNYMLVKNGYEQLPIGLFSDYINYDRQGSYDEMVKLVADELAKLPKPLKDKFEDSADMDEHPEGEGEDDGSDGAAGDGDGDQPEYNPKVGDVVKNNVTGELGKVTAVNEDGSVEVSPVDPEKK